jgi:hypothetical protein
MFKAICKLGLEGIVSKKLDAPYKSGPSKAWLKIKNPKAPAATRNCRWDLLTKFYPNFIVPMFLAKLGFPVAGANGDYAKAWPIASL